MITKEEIREEFKHTVELYLGRKLKEIENTTHRTRRIEKRIKHLDTLHIFNEIMNLTINKILEKHNYEFQNDEEFAEFNEFIKPAFDEMLLIFKVVGYEK